MSDLGEMPARAEGVAITDISGSIISQQRYLPFGQVRTDIGSITQTDLGYTGQRNLDSGMGGLMDYHARFYSPTLGRFTQPDTIIPDPSNPQAWNRYSYAINDPIIYNDPTGHCFGPVVVICGEILVGLAVVAFVATVAYMANPNVRESINQTGRNFGTNLERWQRGFLKHEEDLQIMNTEATQTGDDGRMPKKGGGCTSSIGGVILCALLIPVGVVGLLLLSGTRGGCGEDGSNSKCKLDPTPESKPTPSLTPTSTPSPTSTSTRTPLPTSTSTSTPSPTSTYIPSATPSSGGTMMSPMNKRLFEQ